jgi:putative spermidine/putrescine transport system ATP-binding protein
MSSAKTILELLNLSKSYGLVRSVDDISLELAQGEFMSFLGPSGSGKTTTLNMIAGLTNPSDGDILLQGRPITAVAPYKRNIGMVFQNYALFPHMSVAANVSFPLEMRKMSKPEIRPKVERALDLVGLSGFAERLPSQLSGGQQQRVALARAMVFEPPLLLMDEPLGALDKQLREHMQLEIRRLHQRLGITIIYVTHDQDEALTMSDRIGIFSNGRIEQIGRPHDLYESPATIFVAGFLGQTNLINGKVSGHDAGKCRIASNGFEFQAASNATVSRGQDVTVSLRPERAFILPQNSAAPEGHNLVPGTVTESVYFGRSRRYVVDAGDSKIVVNQQIRDADETGYFVGDTVGVHWACNGGTMLVR